VITSKGRPEAPVCKSLAYVLAVVSPVDDERCFAWSCRSDRAHQRLAIEARWSVSESYLESHARSVGAVSLGRRSEAARSEGVHEHADLIAAFLVHGEESFRHPCLQRFGDELTDADIQADPLGPVPKG
jgi:hypothetical protein